VSVPCRAQYLAAVACAGIHHNDVRQALTSMCCCYCCCCCFAGLQAKADSDADAVPQDQHIAVADIHMHG